MRSSTRSRARTAEAWKRSGRRSSGDCGSATSRAASPSVSRRRFLAEIRERGGPDPFQIAAIRGEREVEPEDLVLAQNALELNGADRLSELDVKRALAPRLEQAGDLHGDGRAAGDDVPMGDELQRGAAEGERIDAVMLEEALVLIGKEHVEKARIDLLSRCRQAPAALARDVGPKQLARCGRARSSTLRGRARAAPDRTSRSLPTPRRSPRRRTATRPTAA